jgi:hypothetical protein
MALELTADFYSVVVMRAYFPDIELIRIEKVMETAKPG